MYYEIEWFEENAGRFRRVFRAKDIPALWRAVHYMNMERKERDRPLMKKIRVTVLDEYKGEHSAITGSFVKDMRLDRYLNDVY